MKVKINNKLVEVISIKCKNRKCYLLGEYLNRDGRYSCLVKDTAGCPDKYKEGDI